MTSFYPSPQSKKELFVNTVERILRNNVPIKVRPGPKLPIEMLDEMKRLYRTVGLDKTSKVNEQSRRRSLGRLDEQLAIVR